MRHKHSSFSFIYTNSKNEKKKQTNEILVRTSKLSKLLACRRVTFSETLPTLPLWFQIDLICFINYIVLKEHLLSIFFLQNLPKILNKTMEQCNLPVIFFMQLFRRIQALSPKPKPSVVPLSAIFSINCLFLHDLSHNIFSFGEVKVVLKNQKKTPLTFKTLLTNIETDNLFVWTFYCHKVSKILLRLTV